MGNKCPSKILLLLGPEGSFSDEAAAFEKQSPACGKLSWRWRKKYVSSFSALFKNIRPGIYGLAPVKNKIMGSIKGTRNLFKRGDLKIISRFRMPIVFVLAALKKTDLKNVKKVYCSPIAKAQCGNFLKKNLARAKVISKFDSTSMVFKKCVQQHGGRDKKWCKLSPKHVEEIAVIGSKKAAKIYGLKILAQGIQDAKKNWTEFVLFTSRSSSG